MKSREPHEIVAGLIEKQDLANRLRAFAEDPVIEQFFDKTRETLVAEMVATDVDGDDARRNLAFMIRTLDGLRGVMRGAIAAGDRARAKMEKRIEKERENG